jgi:hypothetical protein
MIVFPYDKRQVWPWKVDGNRQIPKPIKRSITGLGNLVIGPELARITGQLRMPCAHRPQSAHYVAEFFAVNK